MSWCWPWKIVEKSGERKEKEVKAHRLSEDQKNRCLELSLMPHLFFAIEEEQGQNLFDEWASSSFKSNWKQEGFAEWLIRNQSRRVGGEGITWNVGPSDSDHEYHLWLRPDKTVQIVSSPNTWVVVSLFRCHDADGNDFPKALRGEKAMEWCAIRVNCTCQMHSKKRGIIELDDAEVSRDTFWSCSSLARIKRESRMFWDPRFFEHGLPPPFFEIFPNK